MHPELGQVQMYSHASRRFGLGGFLFTLDRFDFVNLLTNRVAFRIIFTKPKIDIALAGQHLLNSNLGDPNNLSHLGLSTTLYKFADVYICHVNTDIRTIIYKYCLFFYHKQHLFACISDTY